MNIFEQYGIKEVADCTLYSIELDENDDEIYIPVLYLDTLKVSTVEGTASQVSATGGLGNAELIIWDFGREITVNLEDALYSPASQSMTWGGKYGAKTFSILGSFAKEEYQLDKYGRHIYLNDDGSVAAHTTQLAKKAKVNIDNFDFFKETGNDIKKYMWRVNLRMMSYDGVDSYYKEGEVGISYNYDGELWRFETSNSNFENSTATTTTDNLIFYKKVKNKNGDLVEVPVGKFTIVDELNQYVVPPQEAIYQIKQGIDNVYYLDRCEKCRASQTFVINTDTNTLHANYRYLPKYSQCEFTVFIDPKTMMPYEPNTDEYTRKNGEVLTGNLRVIKQYDIYYKWTRSKAYDHTSLGSQIVIDATHFPGTYRLVGETYSRSRKTGKDQRYQFEIPLCKMSSDTNLTLQADGDPTTFNMALKVLRKEDGTMMKLTQYHVKQATYDGYESGSTVITPIDEIYSEDLSEFTDGIVRYTIDKVGEDEWRLKETINGISEYVGEPVKFE